MSEEKIIISHTKENDDDEEQVEDYRLTKRKEMKF